MDLLQAVLPYLDSLSVMLVLTIVALWGLLNQKDAKLLGRLEAEISQLRKELDEEKVKIKDCTHERAMQEIKDALQSQEIESLKRRCEELEHENKTLRNMYNKYKVEKIGL